MILCYKCKKMEQCTKDERMTHQQTCADFEHKAKKSISFNKSDPIPTRCESCEERKDTYCTRYEGDTREYAVRNTCRENKIRYQGKHSPSRYLRAGTSQCILAFDRE